MRQIDEPQQLMLSQRDTLPVYLVALGDGAEYLSTNGNRTVGDVQYIGGDVGLSAMQDWSTATLTLMPTPARVAWMISGEWRGLACDISLLPGANFDTLVEPDYWEPDYAYQGVRFADPILLMPGRLDSARMAGNGRVEFTVVHRSRTAKWSPSFRIGPPWCNHLPRAGEVIEWGSERYIVEGRA
jgi:hypothetical protein